MQVQLLLGVPNIWVWCSGSTPVRGTGGRRFNPYHSDHFIWVVKPFGHTRKAERICNRLLSGEIQVQPLGDPPNFWAFGRTVMHLTLNQADVGSTPTAPTKDAPVTQLADVSGLKLESCEFDSRRGYSGDRALFGSAVS